MRRLPLLAVLLAALIAAPACGAAPAAEPLETLVHDGRTRTALVRDYSGGRKAPLVLVLHGAGGNAEITARMTRFDEVARREGLIVAYPNGTGRFADRFLTWNAGHCCAYAFREQVDDLGYLSALIDRLVATRSVDPSRVYVTGLSNGGMMAHRAGIFLSDKVAAIAPVIGAVFGDEPPPKRPVPALIVVGADDRIMPGAGGMPGAGLSLPGGRASEAADRPIAPARAQADYWAKADGCRTEAVREEPSATVTTHGGCRGGAEVRFYVVKNNGHAWPGGEAARPEADRPTQAFDATEVIWDFFRRHRLPAK
jgi:polyhydroxybutyrate depolymerase